MLKNVEFMKLFIAVFIIIRFLISRPIFDLRLLSIILIQIFDAVPIVNDKK